MTNQRVSQLLDGASLATQISRLDRHSYLFGQNITNSLSPYLHHVVYTHLGLNWGQVRLDSSDMDLFLKLIQHPDFYGASITMPHKVAILPHLDDMTDECRDVGACNTVYLREKHGHRIVCGTNTDVIGIRDAFYRNVGQPWRVFHGRPALVIGGGGAARSAVYALRKWMKPQEIYLVNRDVREVEAVIQDCMARGYGERLIYVSSVQQAEKLEDPGAIIACVPDIEPQTDEEKLSRQITKVFLNKRRKGAMVEMCYNPTPFTRLGGLAEANGWQVILGTEALIWQGLEQDKYWTGRAVEELPADKVHAAIAQKVAERKDSRL